MEVEERRSEPSGAQAGLPRRQEKSGQQVKKRLVSKYLRAI